MNKRKITEIIDEDDAKVVTCEPPVVSFESKFTTADEKLYQLFQDSKFSDYRFDFSDAKTLYISKQFLRMHSDFYKRKFMNTNTSSEASPHPCRLVLHALALLSNLDVVIDPYPMFLLFSDWESSVGKTISRQRFIDIEPDMLLKCPSEYKKLLNKKGIIWNLAASDCPLVRYNVDLLIKYFKVSLQEIENESIDDPEIFVHSRIEKMIDAIIEQTKSSVNKT